MNIINRIINNIDAYQRRHKLPGFIYAVIKKYGDDQAGYQAALLTYYGFLSLFPLLLVMTTVAGLVAKNNPHLQHTIITSMTSYFPVLGNQLSDHIQTLHGSGVALAIGLLLTLYGARGVADALRHGINHVWQVPIEKRIGFPKAILNSLSIIVVGGIGLLGAAIIASVAAAASHGFLFRVLSIAINPLVLFLVFSALLNLSLPKHISLKQTRAGAITAAIGLVILQLAGGYLLRRELKSLDALYSNFAVALGLLFWIYLQAQVLYYAIEVTNVSTRHLWPRSITGKLTPADKQTYRGQASKEQVVPQEDISTSFSK